MAVNQQDLAHNLGLLDPETITIARQGDNPDNTSVSDVLTRLKEAKPEAGGADAKAAAGAAVGAVDWDSAANPYKTKYTELLGADDDSYLSPEAKAARAEYSDGLSRIQQERASIEATLAGQVAAKQLSQEHATALMDLAVSAAQDKLALRTLQRALLPAALREAASNVARRFSVGKAVITVEDLAGETTIQGMTARAKALQEFRRNSASQSRQTSGADRLEAGQGTSVAPPALDDLSPFAMIKEGLRRSQKR